MYRNLNDPLPQYDHTFVPQAVNDIKCHFQKRGCVVVVFLKMAENNESNQPNGYHYEFLEAVYDMLYCKKCNLVARRMTATSCCGESYCHACIADFCDQHKPCPECGEENFSIYEQLKYQKRIKALQVYCSLKHRGCGWVGQLNQLDHHLDCDQGDCQYVDIKCPLNCLQVLPKNEVEQHLSEACTKRLYVCRHCAFKATYEEVVEKHLPECKYVPLLCPNHCGVACEREDMEDHMKICRLEEMMCKFSSIGCDGRYVREDEDEYTKKNTQKHLMLIAADAVKIKQQLLDQEQKLREQQQKFEEQGQKLGEWEQKLRYQKQKLGKYQQTLQDLELRLMTENKKHVLLKEDLDRKDQSLDTLMVRLIYSSDRFVMSNFRKEKAKDKPGDWKSPPTYTHLHGYKFCIGVDANGVGRMRGRGISVHLYAMAGEFDEDLKWPVEAKFTVGLINQREGRDAEYTECVRWDKPKTRYQCLESFGRHVASGCRQFVDHLDLKYFLTDDSLQFYINEVNIY